jgi:hypothetical protein
VVERGGAIFCGTGRWRRRVQPPARPPVDAGALAHAGRAGRAVDDLLLPTRV